MLTIPAPKGKETCSWWQVGWCYLLKGYDTPIFVKKVEQCYSLSAPRVFDRDRFGELQKKTIFFDVSFKIEDWMYIAPLNQYEIGVTNEEIIKELNSFWPATFNTYDK